MHYTFYPQGVCSRKIELDIENGRVHNIHYLGGCNGNLKALGALAEKRGAGKYEVVSSLPGEDGETWCMLKWLGRAYPELEPVYMGFSLE